MHAPGGEGMKNREHVSVSNVCQKNVISAEVELLQKLSEYFESSAHT